jgi:hypothetical protein
MSEVYPFLDADKNEAGRFCPGELRSTIHVLSLRE